MFNWIYDVAWGALLTLRQGPKEALGAHQMLGRSLGSAHPFGLWA